MAATKKKPASAKPKTAKRPAAKKPASAKRKPTTKTKRASPKKKPATTKAVKFSFYAPEAASVHVAGTFNSWSDSKHKLTKGKDGHWFKSLKLKPGRYEYLFVINGELWECDQNPDGCTPNEYGGMNCVKDV